MTTTTGRTRTPPEYVECHPDTPTELVTMVQRIAEVLWVFEWTDAPGHSMGEFYIDTDTAQPRLVLETWVRNTDDPEDDVVRPLTVSLDVVLGEHPAQQVRGLIHSFLTHEADEQMFLNSVKIFDPHLYDRDVRTPLERQAVEDERAKWDL